jgi:release factor glutamine methyltransferase
MNESEMLFSEILNCDRTALYLNKDKALNKANLSLISGVLKRRIAGEPIQYILGKADFMGLKFIVNKEVLIPRPETEVLVETILRIGSRVSGLGYRFKILDVGTGSGCIAVSLAKTLPGCKIDATDISAEALKIAEENAALNKVNINFIQSDLFSAFSHQPSAFSFIISNPPYIPTEEINLLQPEIQHEPRIALDGGSDGLDFYRRLITGAPLYLEQGGMLIMEMGFGQKEGIKNILQNSRKFEIIEIVKDYNNIDRIIVARKHG